MGETKRSEMGNSYFSLIFENLERENLYFFDKYSQRITKEKKKIIYQ